jgi:hypothetical protein
MKRFMSVALSVALLAIAGMAQTSMTPALKNAPARKSPLAGYAGAWIATFQGHAWMSIKLVDQNNQLTGTLLRPTEMEYENSGALKSVSKQLTSDPIERAEIQGDGLLLTVKNPTTQQTEHYVMRLMSADTAELKMAEMSMPPGMPKPMPWELSRVGPSTVPTR